jgi:uncharacterized RDD family membrane protein YckC
MTKRWTNSAASDEHAIQNLPYVPDTVEPVMGVAETAASELDVSPNSDPNADTWRVEVAARVQRYRTRRKPRTPRYPSLFLFFDAPENRAQDAPLTRSVETEPALSIEEPRLSRNCQSSEFQTSERQPLDRHILEPQTSERGLLQSPEPAHESSGRVIEFPRSAAIPVLRPSELADPVVDHERPRIVEAPEILLPPPALGGLLIEPIDPEPSGEQSGSPAAIQSAPLARRALAAFVDAVIVATALAGFAAIFLRLNPSLNFTLSPVRGPLTNPVGPTPAVPIFALAFVLVAILLWTAYQFLFVAYIGSTPGLRAARLRLTASDGSPLHRRARCWRVVASFLCVFSAGLGYLWCVLDQDGLCWHDRISRTHVQSAKQPE